MALAHGLRKEVFVDEQGFSLEADRDEQDKNALHVLGLDETGAARCTARVFADAPGVWHAGRIAVQRGLRGQGVGRLLLAAVADKARAQGANAYLAAQGSALRAADITGVTGQGLLQYLRGGDPVIVWITKDLSAPRTGGCTWLLADTGETYVPYVNLHCVVLAGWDGDTCTIADPLQGRRRVDAAAFLQCFRQMGSRAVVVH